MNRKILSILAVVAIPVGAILLNACGPVETTDNALAMDEASDNWIYWDGHISEYGACYDGFDNNGNGLKDSEDPDCHIYIGPVRDLSVAGYPVGHNFLPDIAKIPEWSPAAYGGFRDPGVISRWLRFLTELDGDIAGIDVDKPGFDITLVPLPQPTPEKIFLGTYAEGNNNNLDVTTMHTLFLDHSFLPAGAVAPAAEVVAPAAGVVEVQADTRYVPPFNRATGGPNGGIPGSFMNGAQRDWSKPAMKTMNVNGNGSR